LCICQGESWLSPPSGAIGNDRDLGCPLQVRSWYLRISWARNGAVQNRSLVLAGDEQQRPPSGAQNAHPSGNRCWRHLVNALVQQARGQMIPQCSRHLVVHRRCFLERQYQRVAGQRLVGSTRLLGSADIRSEC